MNTTNGLGSVDDAKMKEFCAVVGALILFASRIDAQLTRALVCMFALPEHPMIEPLVAQMDIRAKADLIKKRAKLIPTVTWKNRITNWAERAEQVNGKRNMAAHHGISVEDGRIILFSPQLTKIIGNLETVDNKIVEREKVGQDEIEQWLSKRKPFMRKERPSSST